MTTFESIPGFCPLCGSIFPKLHANQNVTCYNCRSEFKPDIFGDQEVEFTIFFNSYDSEQQSRKSRRAQDDQSADGPVVDRKCSKCGHEKMSYATLQLRSADEGQTVFFTCLKCKFKESENS